MKENGIDLSKVLFQASKVLLDGAFGLRFGFLLSASKQADPLCKLKHGELYLSDFGAQRPTNTGHFRQKDPAANPAASRCRTALR